MVQAASGYPNMQYFFLQLSLPICTQLCGNAFHSNQLLLISNECSDINIPARIESIILNNPSFMLGATILIVSATRLKIALPQHHISGLHKFAARVSQPGIINNLM
jgi:hypothetical protein